jgi:hypothetical protein
MRLMLLAETLAQSGERPLRTGERYARAMLGCQRAKVRCDGRKECEMAAEIGRLSQALGIPEAMLAHEAVEAWVLAEMAEVDREIARIASAYGASSPDDVEAKPRRIDRSPSRLGGRHPVGRDGGLPEAARGRRREPQRT